MPAADSGKIIVRGAREHNLRNISLELPRDKLIVFTGLSGSGKSSLAFDTIYAEGQRRYVESLSRLRPPVPRADGQARRRLHRRAVAGDLDRPEVGVAQPAVDGRHHHRGLRLPPAAVRPHRRAALPERGTRITRQTPQQIVDRMLELPEGTRFQVLAPVVRGRKGTYETLLADLAGKGFARARVDGEVESRAQPTSRPRPLREAHDRGRRRSPGRATASSAGSPTRSKRR